MSLGGRRYFISFVDDYSRQTWMYLIEKKSEVFDCSWNLKILSKGKQGGQSSVCGRMAGKSTFPDNAMVICNKWELDAN